jgi:HAD superfamily hydrolase (TIGR01509 family)
MLQALVFDVDGTLADTEEAHLAAFNQAFRDEGLDWHWTLDEYIDLLAVSGGKERMLHYWNAREPDLKELEPGARQALVDRLHEQKTAYYEAAVQAGQVQWRPGVLALMHEARQAGLRLAVATTTSPANVAALMRTGLGADWRSLFASIAHAGNAPLKKPHPQAYLHVLSEMALSAHEAVAFEDSANGLQAAMAAGLATVITPNPFTAHHNFEGALQTVPDLGAVQLAHVRNWFSSVAV